MFRDTREQSGRKTRVDIVDDKRRSDKQRLLLLQTFYDGL